MKAKFLHVGKRQQSLVDSNSIIYAICVDQFDTPL